GCFGGFPDRFRYFVGLAKTDADFSVVIPRHDQRAEAETASTLDYLRATVDENLFLGCVAFCRRSFIGAAIGTSAWVWCRHLKISIHLRAPHRPALSLSHGKCSPRDQTPRSPPSWRATSPRLLCRHVRPRRGSLPHLFRLNLFAG